jgi:CheY-like chemotaxis protein
MSQPVVLIADDEPIVREVLARYLELDGFDVRAAADGQAALDAVASEPATWCFSI